MDLHQAIKKFLQWGTGEYAEDTLMTYKNFLDEFADWCGDVRIKKIELFDHIVKFRRYLNKKGHKEGTINIAMISLRRLFKLLSETEHETNAQVQFEWSAIPVKNNIYKDSHNPLDEQDYRDMVNRAVLRKDFVGVRDEAIMRLLWSTGVRVSELTDLDVENVNLPNEQSITVITRKRRDGVNKRTVPFTKYCKKALSEYLQMREAEPEEPLWISTRGPKAGQRMSARSVQRRITHYAKEAGLDHDKISPHSFRHSIGERAADSFMDERYLGRLMGHATPGGTDVYFNVKNPKLQKHYHETIGDNADGTIKRVWSGLTETLIKAGSKIGIM